MKTVRFLVLLVCFCFMSACVGTAIGVVTDAAIEVAKVPFKVAGAVVDVVSGDD